MDKQYRYTLRKTTLGLASVAIAAFLAGQAPTALASETDEYVVTGTFLNSDESTEEDTQEDREEVTPDSEVTAEHSNQDENLTEGITDEESDSSDEGTDLTDEGEELPAEDTLDMSDEEVPASVAQAEGTEPNYANDEDNIQDYNGDERYKTTDLQQGDTNQSLDITDEKVVKDGFKFETKNPAADSPNKIQYGYQITIDKKTGQRTYTRIDVTDSGLIPVNPGDKSMMNQGDKLTPESPGVTYKPNEDTKLTASRSQRNLNYEASEETLKHINNKDNDSTFFGFKDNYTQNNPENKFFRGNFGITYKVNPWPNENDSLQLMKLNGEYNEKVFVQGQDFSTGIKVDNIDENAKERLVGQVYHPVTGEIVPGAVAYIDNDGIIRIKMPQGAVNQDGTVNKDSIFYKDNRFKGIQSLDVKFFARPRTADEFKAIADAGEDEYEKGTYVGTGAGTATINHKGKSVTIDKQGIDRYDHYNLIGGFKLNLDDTRYYDQSFKDGNGDDTTKHTSSAVKPGVEFNVDLYVPEERKDEDLFPNQKHLKKCRKQRMQDKQQQLLIEVS